jgi:hypothetical protein
MQPRLWLSALLALMLLLTASCAQRLTTGEQFIKESPKPYKRITDYSDALKKLGTMIGAYNAIEQDALVIQAKPVTNRSACKNLPMDITDMIESAVNKIGDKIRCALYEPAYIIGEVQTGSTTIGRQLPELVIDGAITECDENLDTQSYGVDADIMLDGDPKADIGGGYQKSITYSRLAVDLHFMEYATQMLIPDKQTSMAVEVWNLQKSYNFGFQINGSGLGIDGRRKVVQGKHDAIRILVELSVLQLVGKYLELPYWRCLEGAEEDADVIGMLNKQFLHAPPEKRVSVIQTLLLRHGYRLSASGQMDSATVNAIKEVAAGSGGQAPAQISPQLYRVIFTHGCRLTLQPFRILLHPRRKPPLNSKPRPWLKSIRMQSIFTQCSFLLRMARISVRFIREISCVPEITIKSWANPRTTRFCICFKWTATSACTGCFRQTT